jgi:hypothetical protein
MATLASCDRSVPTLVTSCVTMLGINSHLHVLAHDA